MALYVEAIPSLREGTTKQSVYFLVPPYEIASFLTMALLYIGFSFVQALFAQSPIFKKYTKPVLERISNNTRTKPLFFWQVSQIVSYRPKSSHMVSNRLKWCHVITKGE